MSKQNGPPKQKVTTTPPTIKPIELPTYKLGDRLPSGGIVFHVDASGQHGLVAQPKDETKKANWREAQRLASAHGQSWPIWDELRLLYAQRNVVGGFADDYYWSSTESVSRYAWSQNFNYGAQSFSSKNSMLPVRSVLAF